MSLTSLNTRISNPTSSDFKQYNGRLDADVTSKDHASFAIYWVPATTTTYNGGLGYDLFNHSQVNDAFSVIWNHVFSPTFLNEARANAAGWRYNEVTDNPQAPFGLPQDSVTAIGSITLGDLGVSAPNHLDQWTYGYKDVATKVLHAQTMKFGFDFTRLYYLNDPIGTPNYTFYNIWDFLNDAPEAEGGNFQATTGLPGGFRNDNREDVLRHLLPGRVEGSAQPHYQRRPALLLLRTADRQGQQHGRPLVRHRHQPFERYHHPHRNPAWNAQKLNFGPQVGFNWSPLSSNGRIVFRGGYGLNYNQQQIATANNYDGNPPGTNYLFQAPAKTDPRSIRISSTRFRAARPTSMVIRQIRTPSPPLTPWPAHGRRCEPRWPARHHADRIHTPLFR